MTNWSIPRKEQLKKILKSHNPGLGTRVPEGSFRVPTKVGYPESLFLLSQNTSTSSWRSSTLYMDLSQGTSLSSCSPTSLGFTFTASQSPLGQLLYGNQLWNTFLGRSVFLACYYKSLWIITFLFFITWIGFPRSDTVSKYSPAFIYQSYKGVSVHCGWF